MPKTASQAALDMFAEHADIFSEAFDVSVSSININSIATYFISLSAQPPNRLSKWTRLSQSTQSLTYVICKLKFLLLCCLVSFLIRKRRLFSCVVKFFFSIL